MNGAEAARRSGYRGNANKLASVAKENLRKPHIREEVDKRIERDLSEARISVEAILRRLTLIGEQALADRRYMPAIRCLEPQGKVMSS